MADAVVSDGSAVAGLREAAKVDKHHSERNAHRLFNRYGLSLRVPISQLEVSQTSSEDSVTIPFLKLSDFLQLILNKYEQLMFGGLTAATSRQLLSSFWSRYQSYHKNHVVYSLSEEDRSLCIPVLVHGDKGRTLQKSPIFILGFQFPFGLPPELLRRVSYDASRSTRNVEGGRLNQPCSCRAKKRTLQETDFSACTRNDPAKVLDPNYPKSHQRHNNKGHSFLSRFLICAVPSKTYKKNSNVLPSLLKQVSQELKVLFESGLTHSKTGIRYRFVLIGAKGDAEWHFEAGNFNRSYHRTGPVNALKICPLCDAGAEGIPYSDVSSAPEWLRTVGSSEPWLETPPLNEAPFSVRANLYKFDPFHVLKFGIFRDAVASTIIRLAFMGFFDFTAGESRGVPERLLRAFSLYKLWCLAEKKNPSLKTFSRANMNFDKNYFFAWINCKGSEVVLLMQWLAFLLPSLEPRQESEVVVLKAMSQMIEGGLCYIGVMHSHGLWLPRCCARVQLEGGFSFVRGYAWMAQYCTNAALPGYRLRPKLHYMMHILMDAQSQYSQGAEFILSSSIHLCEMDEDYIGRLSRVSRRVAAKTAGYRTTQRYLTKLRLLLDKLFK